jgi:hypothetical protein
MKGGQNARNALEQKKITSFIVHNESPYFICIARTVFMGGKQGGER